TNPYLKASLQPNICNDEDIQVIQISTPNIEPIFLFNIYNETPPHDRTLPYTVERTLKHITLPERTILAGDFNAHHLWWNWKGRFVPVTTTLKEKTTPNLSPTFFFIG